MYWLQYFLCFMYCMYYHRFPFYRKHIEYCLCTAVLQYTKDLHTTHLYYIKICASYLSLHVGHCNYDRSFPGRAFVDQLAAYLHLHHRAISGHCTTQFKQVVRAVVRKRQEGAIKGWCHGVLCDCANSFPPRITAQPPYFCHAHLPFLTGGINAGHFSSRPAGAAMAAFTFLPTGPSPESLVEGVIEAVVVTAAVLTLYTTAAAENEALDTLTTLSARMDAVKWGCEVRAGGRTGTCTDLIMAVLGTGQSWKPVRKKNVKKQKINQRTMSTSLNWLLLQKLRDLQGRMVTPRAWQARA